MKTPAQLESARKYNNSEKGRASRRAYHESEKGKATRRAYLLSEKGKASSLAKNKRYRTSLSPEAMAEKERAHNLKRHYGITIERHEEMKRAQNFSCAICFRTLPLSVDHNHETGKVRALLCRPCNSALGMFQESLTVLESAKNYLQKHNDP